MMLSTFSAGLASCRSGGVALNEPEETHKHYAAFDEDFPILNAAKK
jgi:hypothetical protein